jgi:curved DNA-binding protein CbpA
MKNHYQILGVHTAAEDLVIKAAYRVLAQKYHPDKWKGDPSVAHSKMAELNAAYATLSDPVLRKKYDAEIGVDDYANSEDDVEGDLNQAFDAEFSDAWEVALDFYPQIDQHYRDLRKVNVMLANSFKLFLIENQVFSKSGSIAAEMEQKFLEKFFGSDRRILTAVKTFIAEGNRDAVLKVNKYIRVMGKDVSVEQILAKFVKSKNPPKQESRKYSDFRGSESAESGASREYAGRFQNRKNYFNK